MSKEVENFKYWLDTNTEKGVSHIPDYICNNALNYIDKLEKVVDLMADVLNDFDYDKQCEECHTDICSASADGTEYTRCIKEYFYKKTEELG